MSVRAKTRVMIVDDNKVSCKIISKDVAAQSDMEVVGVFHNGDDVLEKSQELLAEVILLDIMLPGANGITIAADLLDNMPDIKTIATSDNIDMYSVSSLVSGGVAGFTHKLYAVQSLSEIIRKVSSGKRFFCEEVQDILGAIDKFEEATSCLSLKEREVLALKLYDTPNSTIADLLGKRVQNVHTYLRRLMDKLNVKNDLELKQWAVELGILNKTSL